jgi:hypothetical protein
MLVAAAGAGHGQPDVLLYCRAVLLTPPAGLHVIIVLSNTSRGCGSCYSCSHGEHA